MRLRVRENIFFLGLSLDFMRWWRSLVMAAEHVHLNAHQRLSTL